MSNNHRIRDISGSNNIVNNGNVYNFSLPEPKANIMQKLLQDIAIMLSDKQYYPELPDTELYNILDKIEFNNLKRYADDYEYYDEGMYIIEQRLKTIEESADGSIRHQIIQFVNNVYRGIKYEAKNITADDLIHRVECKIKDDLKEYYKHTLSPEDLSYVGFVVFFVFASCKIFDKPTAEYMAKKNVNS